MASNELKISEVRTVIKEEEDSKPRQIIKLKPINQLTKAPQAVARPKQIVGNTTIRLIQNDNAPKVTMRPPERAQPQIVVKNPIKIITKPPLQVLKKVPPEMVATSRKIQFIGSHDPKVSERNDKAVKSPPKEPVKTYKARPTKPSSENGQRSVASNPPRELVYKYDEKIPGMHQNIVDSLPSEVIDYIKRINEENNKLRKMLLDFRKESVQLANHLLKFSHEVSDVARPSYIPTMKPLKGTLKRKEPPSPSPAQPEKEPQEPEAKKVKKTIRLPKFPISTVQGLLAFEKDLSTPGFYSFVHQRIRNQIGSLEDISEENLLDSVLAGILTVDVLGEIGYNQDTNSLCSYQECFKDLKKFRDLYAKLLNGYSFTNFQKGVQIKDIETFLQRKILMHGKILQFQKNNEKASEKKENKAETFRWLDEDESNDGDGFDGS